MTAGPTLKGNLYDALVAAFAADPTVLVAYGLPTEDSADMVSVLGWESEEQPGPLAASRPADETVRLTVMVRSFRGGDDQRAVDERAGDLAATVRDTVRADQTLGGVAWRARVQSMEAPPEMDLERLTAGRYGDVVVTVVADARI